MKSLLLLFLYLIPSKEYYKIQESNVRFTSSQTQETIRAYSKALKGVIDENSGHFRFSIAMNTFEGFNSPLQKEHFNENYIESNRFPEAQFIGRVIEQIDWAKPGNYPIRAKGDFMLHGLTKNLIIPSQIQVISEQEIRIKSQFKISLSEFGIKIPRMVHKKLAEMIDVSLDCRLIKTDS